MTTLDTTEFDAFGPWIDKVTTQAEMPRLFRTYALDFGTTHTVLKVPRNIARRDADPSMDLYDVVLIVGPDALTVLRRADDTFTTSVISYAEITAFEDSVELLDGLFVVHTVDGDEVPVPYNGSSRAVVESLMAELRRMIAPKSVERRGAVTRAPLERGELGRDGNGLVAAYWEITRVEPSLQLLSAHPNRRLATSRGLVDKVTLWIRRATLQGAIISASDTELSIVSRRDWIVPGKRPALSESRRVIPLNRITAVTTRPHPRFAAASVVTIEAGHTHIDCVIPAGSHTESVLLTFSPADNASADTCRGFTKFPVPQEEHPLPLQHAVCAG